MKISQAIALNNDPGPLLGWFGVVPATACVAASPWWW
jgi:hypothetical protein